ncbi:small nuclear ribonucleoprotein [Zopfochytrium polystomum]|nr:small nuclear ribonucleoprotein [Zopfochytrium polystomum]
MSNVKVTKIMVQPINLIFRFLQQRSKVQIWLYEQVDIRIEGRIIGFDEFMSLVLDDAEEVSVQTGDRKPLGRILLKGDNITLLRGE